MCAQTVRVTTIALLSFMILQAKSICERKFNLIELAVGLFAHSLSCCLVALMPALENMDVGIVLLLCVQAR